MTGWDDSHLNAFEVKNRQCVMAGGDEFGDFPDDLIEDGVRTAELTGAGDTGVYEYDYGDSW